MILSRYTINHIANNRVKVPDGALLHLPEKVLQFGTGDLLRSLPDQLIAEANEQGIFNGRIVAVTASATEASLFEKQDCFYTVVQNAGAESKGAARASINTAISRVLHDKGEWQQVLDCAHNPELKLVLCGPLEEGAPPVNDDVRLHPPKSFPGKLLAFMYERYQAFGGSQQSGLVVVPTSSTADAGKKLEALVFELAHLNSLDDAFIEWLESSSVFCHAVATTAGVGERSSLAPEDLGYTDALLIVADAAAAWVIETEKDMSDLLPFADVADARLVGNFRDRRTEPFASAG